MKKSKFIFALSVYVYVLASTAEAAWRFNWEVGADLEYSDNIGRSDGDEDDAVFLQPRFLINTVHEGPKIDLEIGAANEYRSRLSGDQGSNNNFDLDGFINWKISPGLFEWSFEDHFNSEFPIDIRSDPNEGNNQDVNSFSTGPTFTPRIFNRTNLIFQGRYFRTDAEESDIDNDRVQGRVGIERQLTPSSSISLNYLYEDTNFDDESNDPLEGDVDFDRDNYFIAYSVERDSLSLNAQLGYTEIERDEGENRSSEGGNHSVSVNYILNSTSSVVLTAYDQFTDSTSDAGFAGGSSLGSGFGSVGGGGSTGIISDTPLGDVVVDVTGDTVDSEGFLLGLNKRFSKLDTSFQYFLRDDDHDLVDINDRDSSGAILELSLPVGSTSLLGLVGEYRTTDFDIGDREDDDLLVALTGEYYVRSNLKLGSSIEYRDRDSTIDGEDFDELQIELGFTYTNF